MNSNPVAIFSPSNDAYSETFIQAHRSLNGGNVIFYYGGLGNISLENHGPLTGLIKKFVLRQFGRLFLGKSKYDISYVLKRSLKKHNVKSVLIEYGNFGADLVPYLDFFKGKITVHFHGYDASMHSVLKDYSKKYVEMCTKVDNVVVVSKVMKNKLLSVGVVESKLCHLVYGPNRIFETVNPDYSSTQICSVGRLVDKKAPYYLVLLMKEVVKEFPNSKLNIVGEGALSNMLKNLIKYFGLENNVQMLGVQSPEQVRGVMSESCCYLQHSITAESGDMEGTPLSVLESSSAGLPVVSTIHAGIPDVILQNETGLLVEEHDLQGMIENVLKLLRDPEEARRLGVNGKERIKNKFTLEKHLQGLDSLMST